MTLSLHMVKCNVQNTIIEEILCADVVHFKYMRLDLTSIYNYKYFQFIVVPILNFQFIVS